MIQIRQAMESDVSAIEEIMLDVVDFFASIGQPQWKRETVSWQALSQYLEITSFYMAYVNDMAVGCMALGDNAHSFWPEIAKGRSLFINKLAVKRCAAKQGVSQALINFAKEQAVVRGMNEVRLDVNQFKDKVRAFYEKEGFVCVDEKCMNGKYPAAFYVWKAELLIRKAMPGDAKALRELYIYYLTENPPADDSVFDASISIWCDKIGKFAESPLYHLLMAEIGGRIVSSVTLIVVENLTYNVRPYSIIENVVTHVDFRGKGYAKQLMGRACEIAAEMGCYKIMLMTGSKLDSTLGFYEGCGFDRNEKTAFIKRIN